MKRIVGFALFWVAAGMLFALVLPGLYSLPDFVYYSVCCSGILPVLLLKIKCKQKNIK